MSVISIIIPTMNRDAILHESLIHVMNASREISTEIIVVNDSKTSIPDMKDFPGVILLNNPRQGVASARNLGAERATSDLLLFLDDDIQINQSSIESVISFHKNRSRVAVNPDWIYPPQLQEKLSHSSFGRFLIHYNLVTCKGWYNHPRWRDNEIFETPMLASFHLSMTKRDFEQAGRYDEIFPHAGFEDHDFPVRMKKSGITLYIDSTSLVYHNESDRQTLDQWLSRQVRGGETRQVGVNIGYSELKIAYTPFKIFILKSLLKIKPLILSIARLVPNKPIFDFIYFRLVTALQAICIFEGYTKSDAANHKA